MWRDGQKKRVYIYRMLCAGSIEEKVLERQPATLRTQPATLRTQPATLCTQPATLRTQPATLRAQPATAPVTTSHMSIPYGSYA